MKATNQTALRPEVSSDDEIDLREYAQALWRGRWAILGVAAAFATGALLAALMAPATYAAKAVLLLPAQGPAGAAQPPSFPVFKALVQGPSLLGTVLEEQKLDGLGVRDTADLLERLGIDQVPETSFVAVTVRLPDARAAASAANRIAELAVDAADGFKADEERRASEALDAEVRDASAKWLEIARKLQEVGVEQRRPRAGAFAEGALAADPYRDPRLVQLETDYRVALELYADGVRRLMQRRVLLVGGERHVARLQERAVAPLKPLPKPTARNALLAALAGFVLSTLGVLALQASRTEPGRGRPRADAV